MEAGACWLSTTRSYQQQRRGRHPMPSRLADEQEMLALSGALREGGKRPADDDQGVGYADSLDRVAGRCGGQALSHRRAAALQSHARSDVRGPGTHRPARSRGRRMYGAVSACPLNFEFTLHEPYVFEGLDAWQPLMKMDEPEVKKALGDAGFRRRLKDELEKRSRRMFTGEMEKGFRGPGGGSGARSLGGAIDRGSGEKAGGASGGLHARRSHCPKTLDSCSRGQRC